MIRKCLTHGDVEFFKRKDGGWRCRPCDSVRTQKHRRNKKLRLVEEAGGACAICGYNRCTEALTFHHRNPDLKEFGFSTRGLTRSMSSLRREAGKCVLLCSNCHAETHAGMHPDYLES